ncbi:MAG: hypothetical protein R3185_07440, partial [Candidatus Thermoplasmatota archaeon]|nr:hypothetical protein [Candidatus Thermoplasmatota archaeon]
LDPPRVGAFVLLYLGALGAGLGVGALLGYLETRSWAKSLRASWQGWMHSAQGAASMGEAAGRTGALHFQRRGLLASILVVLNAAVLIASWFQLPPLSVTAPYGLLAIATVSLTGLSLGALLVLRIAEAWWCRQVERQTLNLVQEGRIGVWGVR